jgi:hypothetical protein
MVIAHKAFPFKAIARRIGGRMYGTDDACRVRGDIEGDEISKLPVNIQIQVLSCCTDHA